MKKKIGMIIQARMSSKRLPGKVMKKILKKPLIYRILERVKNCKSLHQIIVAIPKSNSDNILYRYLKSLKISTFRGSENNLIERYYLAAKKYDLDYIVRLPADNPLPDYKEIDKLVKFHIKKKKNLNLYSTNLQPIKNISSTYQWHVTYSAYSVGSLLCLKKRQIGSHLHITQC